MIPRPKIHLLLLVLGLTYGALAFAADRAPAEAGVVQYKIVLDTLTKGYDGSYCWVHPRAGIVPRGENRSPAVVLTMQKLWLKGSDVFFALNEMRSNDLGRAWMGPYEHTETLGRREEPNGVIVAVSDYWPKWHAKSGKLLGIGHTVRYSTNKVDLKLSRQTAYSVYDPEKRTWAAWKTLALPDDALAFNSGAGSVQRVDLPDGDILLPVYGKKQTDVDYSSRVLRCRFDGTTLSLVEAGNELTVKGARGFVEPSLATFGGRYFLTLRNDLNAYVATSTDGLHFDAPRIWRWDDGSELGSYNTQAHWVTHRDGLFLVYTRKGASNDHVIRHRAPLFIGQVDVEKLAVRRSTERILVPDRGARLGNFGVTEVSPDETWVTVAEWMQTFSPNIIIPVDNPRGADNSVYAARIQWAVPTDFRVK
ncbi:exo-alpha-sialidase [Horticoccus sp. 23ND18S-11]|uniref:exo-alpha-sialidase n=1 Tax=Horticoccus sp. 23ND18S-11 TaxID=3391832 RepID=UPI0039C9E458